MPENPQYVSINFEGYGCLDKLILVAAKNNHNRSINSSSHIVLSDGYIVDLEKNIRYIDSDAINTIEIIF